MKKLFLFLSICSTLFFASCSNFFAPFNNTGRIVINFSSKDAAKSIFTEIPNFEREAAPIKIEIVNDLTGDIESQEITINISDDNPNKSQQQTVTFENVQAGTWTVNCYVLIKDTNGFIIDEIGFDSRTVSVEAGMSADVLLKPEYNIINTSTNQVKTINLIQNPSKLSYVLDDPLEADDAIFELELQNGYKTEMTFGEIKSKFAGTIETRVSFSEPTTSGIPAASVTKATRGNFNIVYKITRILNGNEIPSYFTVPITLKAKPPVITKHPGKETFTGVQHQYKFTVEASLPTYEVPANNTTSASLIYHWDSAGSTYTPSQFDETKVTPYYEGEVNRNDNSNTLYFQYIQCTVINYDKDGLSPELYGNNEYPTTTSRYGTLEERYPSTSTQNARYHMIEADINICSEDTEFISEYKNGEWTTPPVELFVIKKTFDNDVHQNSTSTGRYYDFTESENKYNITVARANYADTSVPCFGYVPYRVSYSFEEDDLTWTNTKTITIPTKLASLPNTLDPKYATDNYDPEFGYNYYERFYNKSDNKYYCKKSDGSLTYSIPNQEKEVNTYKIITEARYYSSSRSTSFDLAHYLNYTGTRNSWSSTEPVNSHKTPISSDQPKVDASYYRIFLSTELTNDELKRIENYGLDIFISLDAVISVSPSYRTWVVDCTPIRKSLPPVKFSLLQ